MLYNTQYVNQIKYMHNKLSEIQSVHTSGACASKGYSSQFCLSVCLFVCLSTSDFEDPIVFTLEMGTNMNYGTN